MPAFTSGTKIFFNQTSAPTGWTKLTSVDDYTLRLVSGATGGNTGGSNSFTTVMVDGTWPATVSSVTGTMVATLADLPAHTHTFNYETRNFANPVRYTAPGSSYLYTIPTSTFTTTNGPAGSGTPHSHGFLATGGITGGPTGFAVKYVDFILCSKN